jgi:alanine racemase
VAIDVAAIEANTRAIAGLVAPARVCAVVKADAYGHGDVPVAEAALRGGASVLAVALVEEGIRLREAGVDAPILLLSEPDRTDAAAVISWDLIPTVYRADFCEALEEAARGPVGVHVKVDTGMHRVGAHPSDLDRLVKGVRRLRPCGWRGCGPTWRWPRRTPSSPTGNWIYSNRRPPA